MSRAKYNGTRPAARDPALDGLRGVAVLLVFLFHYGGGLRSANPLVHALGIVTEAGWTGVVIFFALSGFLITGGLWDTLNPPEASSQPETTAYVLRNFYARRALRILPVYYTAVAAAVLGSLAVGARLMQLAPFAIFLVFLQNVPGLAARALSNPSPLPLYHLWSLAVEEQFYLLWPPLLLFACKSPLEQRRPAAIRYCLGVFVASAIFCLLCFGPSVFFSKPGMTLSPPQSFEYFLPAQCGALALGAALAMLLRSPTLHVQATRLRFEQQATALFLLGMALYLGSGLICGNLYLNGPLQFIVGLPGISLAAAALVAIALRPGLPRSLLSLAPFCWTGRISYSFYVLQVLLQPLFHRLPVQLLHTDTGDLYFGVRFVVALTVSLLMAWLSYHLIERPFLHRKRRFPMHQPLP